MLPAHARRTRSKSLPKRERKCRVLVLSSPKGGTGKTTFTQNLLPLITS